MKYFQPEEFACRCGCGAMEIHPRLAFALDEIRHAVGRPVIVTSGVRCISHNKRLGGARKSYHLPDEAGLGRAADITCPGISARDLERVAFFCPELTGMGRDDVRNFLHVDIRPGKRARWCYVNKRVVLWKP